MRTDRTEMREGLSAPRVWPNPIEDGYEALRIDLWQLPRN